MFGKSGEVRLPLNSKIYEASMSCLEDQEWFEKLSGVERDQLAWTLAVKLRGCAAREINRYESNFMCSGKWQDG